jgi:uncharacterized protein (TIGR02646 family)
MIQLASKALSATTQKTLEELQKEVDGQATFLDKAEKAQTLWDSKGGVKGKNAFKEIVTELEGMCVYVGVCNYCEQSEANDVEHIYPKSFFPRHAFVWTNYLLACKQCNSAYKLDKCFVIDTHHNLIEVLRKKEPPFNTVAFINPRTEDPNKFMILELLSFKFILLPGLNAVDTHKANSTLDILQLNHRDTLIQARKSAAMYFYQRMVMLVGILRTQNLQELEDLLTPYDEQLDKTKPLPLLKQELTISLRRHITSYQHPSVWHAIKVIESKVNDKWKAVFQQIPDALNW